VRRLIVLLATLLAVTVATGAAMAEFTPDQILGVGWNRAGRLTWLDPLTISPAVRSDLQSTAAPASTVVTWKNSNGGDWSIGSNWSTGAVPTATDDVVIDIPVSAPIRYAAGTSQINSLTSNQPLVLSGGLLEIADMLQSDGTISFTGGNIVSGGAQIYNGAVTVGPATTFQATGATGSLEFYSTLSTGPFQVMLNAAEIDFRGGSNSVTGTGSIVLQAPLTTATIRIGDVSDSGAATLDLTDSDIAALANGFNGVKVGTLGAPSTTLVVDASGAKFLDTLHLQPGGSISLDGRLETSGAAVDVSSFAREITQLAGAAITTHGGAVTLFGYDGVVLNGVITTEGGSVSISTGSQAAVITTGLVGDSIVTTAATDSGLASGAVSLAAQGGVSLSGNIVTRGAANAAGLGSAGGAVSITTFPVPAVAAIDTRGGNGAVAGGAGGSITIGSASLLGTSSLAVNGDLLAVAGSGGAGSVGPPRAGGAISITALGHALLAGEVRTSGASIDVLGNGLDVHGTVSTSGVGIGVGKVTLDGHGGAVTLVAAISAGQGGIEIDGAGVTFHTLTTVGGGVDIDTTTGYQGLVRGDPGSSITTTSGGPGMSSGGVTILGDGGVELNGNIVTRGPDNGSSPFSSGGPVDISARNGSIRLAGIDTRGGSGTSSTRGGSITITGSGVFQTRTIINGALLAGGGTEAATGFQAAGGAIRISTRTDPQPTELLGEVRTNEAPIEIGGKGLEAPLAIATSGLGKVTLHGFDGAVTLHEAVTGGSGGIEITGNGIDFHNALSTSGGNVSIVAAGAAAAVIGRSGGTITTESGSVTIVGNTGVSLEGDIVSAGGTNAAGQGSSGGQVSVSTQSGGISLAGIDSHGGASTAPGSAGGTGGMMSISAGSGGSPTVVNGDLLASGGTEPGASERAPGGAILVNSAGISGDTTLAGEVTTTGSIVDLRGSYLLARGAISTTGGVILRGLGGVTLQEAVSAGGGGIDIAITSTTGGGVALGGALVVSGGDVGIRSGLFSGFGSVSDNLGLVAPSDPIGTSITTTAAPNSGRRSGRVTITTGALLLSSSSIDTSGANNAAGAGSAGGEVRITAPAGIRLGGIDARGGASSAPGFHKGDGGSIALIAGSSLVLSDAVFTPGSGAVTTSGSGGIALRSNIQQVTLEGEVQAGSAGLEIHGNQGVFFLRALRTDGGDVEISTGPTGTVGGATTFGVGGPIVTTAPADSGARSGDVTISGQLGVTLNGDVATTGARNNAASTVSAGGNVHISAPGGSIAVRGVDTSDGLAVGPPPTFGGGTIVLEAGGTASTVGVAGLLSSGTSSMSLLAQDNVHFSATGGVQVEVGGLATGSYTKITASKTFLIGGSTAPGPTGTVRANFFNGFALAPGDRVPFYQTPQRSITGSFETKFLPPHSGLSYGTDVIELVWDDRPPGITSNGGGDSADISVPENQLPVTMVSATDPESDVISYSLSGNDASLFDLIPSSGNTALLNFRSAPNFEAPQDLGQNNVYDVTLVATDALGETDQQELEITVTDVNEAPVLTVISPVSIQQGTTDVEILSATDPDRPPQTLTFSLGGADGAVFQLVPDPQGQRLQFVNPPLVTAPADANGDNVYELTVTVNDGGGKSATRMVEVTVGATPVMTVGVSDKLIAEGQSGTTQMEFTVALSTVATQTVTVDYQTVDGTAVAGSDYVAKSGTLTFMPNERFKTLAIDVIGDTTIEGDETFQIVLSNPVNAVLGAPLTGLSPRATGTIGNDDYPMVGLVRPVGNHREIESRLPPILPVEVSGLEGNSGTSTFAFPVVLTQPALTQVAVHYQVVSYPAMAPLGSATAGVDYLVTSGTLTFIAGETSKTIEVPIIGDTMVEPHEAFKVVLSNPTGATLAPAAPGGFQSEAIGIILDDDGLQAVDDAYTVTQGQALNIAAPGLLANDIERDPSALPLIVTRAVTLPASGNAQALAFDGSFYYMPDVSFTGTDTFVYEVFDSNQRSSTATVTITVLPDGDLDGVADAVEIAAPNGGDGNADGIADSTQADVASLPAAITGQYVTLAASRGATLAQVTTTSTLPPNPPAGSSFPLGLLGFEVRGLTQGGSAQVTLMVPPGVNLNAYYKFGPAPGNTTPHWYAFNYNGTTGAQISGSTVTLNFVDSQRGDADLAANGVIVDPGGPSSCRARCR
jgi:Calx-beta domain/Bacterial Ig domain